MSDWAMSAIGTKQTSVWLALNVFLSWTKGQCRE